VNRAPATAESEEFLSDGGRPDVRAYYVYIMTNRSGTLYTGVTNNIRARACEHKKKLNPGFTARYNIDRLVYYETFDDARAAIAREKQIKGWLRRKKLELINRSNPKWEDLSAGWCE